MDTSERNTGLGGEEARWRRHEDEREGGRGEVERSIAAEVGG